MLIYKFFYYLITKIYLIPDFTKGQQASFHKQSVKTSNVVGCQLLAVTQGSHSSWKTLKNDKSFSSPGKVLKFYNFIKNPGKMGVNLEK